MHKFDFEILFYKAEIGDTGVTQHMFTISLID